MIFLKQNFRALKLVSSIIFVILFSPDSNAQSVSTIGEIYDYEIGDIFHTYEYLTSGPNGFDIYANIEIADKYYSANSDTVFYVRDINRHYSGTDNPSGTTSSYTYTIFYTNLNSLIENGTIDSVYYSENYNGRKVNAKDYGITWYIEGCGGSYFDINTTFQGSNIHHEYKLVYFKKGIEEWGTPHVVSSIEKVHFNPDLKIYPNPASDKLILELPEENNASCSGTIYSGAGKLIEKFSFSPIEIKQLNISSLNSGLYFIRLTMDDNFYSSSFIKN